jgi:23S rRNA pseudouridine1911/1915/1917 synthase
LAAHSIERVYTALVWGHPAAANGLIDAPIGRHPNDPLRMAVVVNGKPARTHFSVDQRFTEPVTALVTCQLETGRTHQIRVHLAAIDHPVVGDPIYGGRRSAALLARPFLHARRLSFEHPVDRGHLEFTSELPADLVAAIPAS